MKGHREKQETDHDTLKREIFEETGITRFNIFNYLGKIRYKIMKEGLKSEKEVKFYYVATNDNRIALSDEHIDYIWLDYDQVLTFHQSKLILTCILAYAFISDLYLVSVIKIANLVGQEGDIMSKKYKKKKRNCPTIIKC